MFNSKFYFLRSLKSRNERTRRQLSTALSYTSQGVAFQKINLLTFSTVLPLMRVGRSTPSSNNVLVVGGLTNMQNKCLMDEIIRYNHDVSGLRNPNMVSVLGEGLQENQNSTRNQPRICLGSSSTMLNYQQKYVSFLDNSRWKTEAQMEEEPHPHFHWKHFICELGWLTQTAGGFQDGWNVITL